MVQDEQLLELMAKGDQTAFEVFVHRYHAPIYQYIERLVKDSKKAEDLVQDTFIRLIKQLQQKHIPTHPKAWLYRVATNICKDYWKSAQYRSESPPADDLPIKKDEKPSVIEIYEHQETRKEILHALNHLPQTQQQIVMLRFFQDLKLKEIAEITDLPLGTVKSNLFHALKKLKHFMEDETKEAAKSEQLQEQRRRNVQVRR
ncbi:MULTISPECIES: RNA polymerase sigma factor [Bacillus]|uniref:RNA polymerase sigma factor n=1 Tax=Bacillus TaxID=1386 RepID=UPI000BB67B24|nr:MULTISPECIES: RNA polymerase sigma factor [Bacillus]